MAIKIRQKKLNEGYVSLYLDIHFKGVRRYEYLKIKFRERPRNPFEATEKRDMLALARRIALHKESELLSGHYGLAEKVKKDVDFFSLFQDYIEKNKFLVDIRCYITTLNKLKKFTGKETLYCQQITDSMLETFAKYLLKQHNGETGYNYFKKLKRVLKFAVKSKLVPPYIASDVTCPKKASVQKDVLTVDEVRKLVSTPCPNPDVKAAFLFSCVTGLRFCDVKAMKWQNIKGDTLRIQQQKTDEELSMVLGDDAKSFLPPRQPGNSHVFSLPSHNGSLKNLRKWTEAAGLDKHITWHCARHSFGTNLIRYGADVLVASKLLGHKSLKYTSRYVRINDDLKMDALKRIPSVFS